MNQVFMSNKPTHYLIDYGDFNQAIRHSEIDASSTNTWDSLYPKMFPYSHYDASQSQLLLLISAFIILYIV